MISFVVALILLVGGYFVYGKFVERVFGVDGNRPTPAITKADGIDYIAMPTWRIFLIQFLNIAGLGPIFGAIMGILFGPAAYLWIVFGTIFAGAVHDYLSGMMSLRRDGMSLPEIVGEELGTGVKQGMRVFALLLLILVGAVFVINPADLLAGLTVTYAADASGALPGWLQQIDAVLPIKWWWVAIVFLYYMLAMLLPIDKLIGRLYPLFGFALLFMAVGILVMLFVHADALPELTDGLYNRHPKSETTPIFPMMFITIACGAISGFHATQSPLMARCLKNERMGRPVFYGAMITEGIVALIWAAAAVAFTGSFENLAQYLSGSTPAVLVNDISTGWLGAFGGFLALLGVVFAPITSGDTALRSARLIAADFLHFDQTSLRNRIIISLPIFVASFAIMMVDFDILWRYFAWCNQTLSVFTLWAITVWLARTGKCYWISLIPALFMTVVTVAYIFYAPEGFALGHTLSTVIGVVVAVLFTALFVRFLRLQSAGKMLQK